MNAENLFIHLKICSLRKSKTRHCFCHVVLVIKRLIGSKSNQNSVDTLYSPNGNIQVGDTCIDKYVRVKCNCYLVSNVLY